MGRLNYLNVFIVNYTEVRFPFFMVPEHAGHESSGEGGAGGGIDPCRNSI